MPSITPITRSSSSRSGTGSAPGPRQLAADVEQVGALERKPQAMVDGGVAIEEGAAIEDESGVTLTTPMIR